MPTADYVTDQILKSQTWLFRLAYKLTLDPDDAKDLVQETVLKILDNKGSFAPDTNFKGWASVIMKNTYINNQRRHSQKLQVNTDDEHNAAILDAVSNRLSDITPESNLTEREILAEIDDCPGDQSLAFRLFIAGYSYKEISELLQLPEGTVKSRIHATRKKLQVQLQGYK